MNDTEGMEEATRAALVRDAALSMASDGILVVDPARRIVEVNPALAEALGYRAGELTGRSTRLLHPDGTSFDRQGRERARPSLPGEGTRYPLTLRRRDGSSLTTTASTRPLRRAGRLLGYVSVLRDLSPAMSRDAFLRGVMTVCAERMLNLDRKLEMLLDLGRSHFGLPEGVVVRREGADHRVVAASGSNGLVAGTPYDLADAFAASGGEPWAATEPGPARGPDDAAEGDGPARARLGVAIQAGRDVWGAVEFRGPATRMAARADGDLSLLMTLAAWIGNEITMRQDAERLMEERERFRELYRTTPAMMHAIDRGGVIRHVSDLWLERTGYRHDEVVGRRSTDFLDEASRRHARETLPRLWSGGALKDVPLAFRCKDGTTLETELTAIVVGEGRAARARAVLTDVGARNRALRELTAANQDLDRLNKSLQEFAYVASHDLQEPLRKIAQFSSFLAEDYGEALDEQGHAYIASLTGAASRMSRLIRDLLAYSRASNAQVERGRVDLGALVGGLVGDFEVAIASSGARVACGPMPVLRADPVQVGQLMRNLIGNALKYRRPEGAPHVAVEAVPEPDGGVALAVRDDGIGFPPEHARLIFEPFKRLHNRAEYEGSGIGLALCRAICERLGWTIGARGEPGAGATFTVVVPAADVLEGVAGIPPGIPPGTDDPGADDPGAATRKGDGAPCP